MIKEVGTKRYSLLKKRGPEEERKMRSVKEKGTSGGARGMNGARDLGSVAAREITHLAVNLGQTAPDKR